MAHQREPPLPMRWQMTASGTATSTRAECLLSFFPPGSSRRTVAGQTAPNTRLLRSERQRRSYSLLRRDPGSPTAAPLSPIWRSACQGVGVDGHCLVGAWRGCGCGWRGGPGVRGVRDGGHAHIRGLAQDLCSSHVRCLKSSAAAGAVAQATDRGVGVREPGILGPPRQPQRVWVGLA
jgi:hypothetical protein